MKVKKHLTYCSLVFTGALVSYIICSYFFERDKREIQYQLLADSYLEMIGFVYDYKLYDDAELKTLCKLFIKKELLVREVRSIKNHPFGVKDKDVLMYREEMLIENFNKLLDYYQNHTDKNHQFNEKNCSNWLG